MLPRANVCMLFGRQMNRIALHPFPVAVGDDHGTRSDIQEARGVPRIVYERKWADDIGRVHISSNYCTPADPPVADV
jgi:hypothetical protein